MTPRTSRVHVIGGGVAGLAAALDLAAAGRAVSIYEAGPACGGRCRSYFDRELGCRIDNGNHLLLSSNSSVMRYLDRTGARATLGGPATPAFPFMDLRSQARWTVRPNMGRLPWWILRKDRGVPGAGLADFARLLRLKSAARDDTVAAVLPHNALYARLIEPLAIAALNTPADQGSARLFWAVIAESLAKGGRHCIPRFPKEGLSESFVDPAIALLSREGAELRTSYRISALTSEHGRVTALSGPDGSVDVANSDSVVLAVPASVAATLLPGTVAPDAHEAILNLHYKADFPPGEAGFVGLIGGLAEWVFFKPGIVSVTISAANRLLDHPAERLAATIWQEIQTVTGSVAEMPQWRLIREKRATFSATPAQQMRRSCATTTLSNLVLAGDWTDTGLPATIEGAIRSGFAAAHHLRVT
jgi:squalene-associated FAD-dependent desaturase